MIPKDPYFWAPFTSLLMSGEGSRQGGLWDLTGLIQNPDMNTEGIRDSGDFVKILDQFDDKKHLASLHKYFFDNYERMLSTDEVPKEIERQSENNIQNAAIMQLMTPVLFLLIHLKENSEKLQNMTEEYFLSLIEKIMVIPFIVRHHLTVLSLDDLRKSYAVHILNDFRKFKENPHLLNKTLIHSIQTDVGRDFPFQSFYALSVFLLSTPALYQTSQETEKKEGVNSFNIDKQHSDSLESTLLFSS